MIHVKKILSLVIAIFVFASYCCASAETYKRNLVDFCQTFFVRVNEWNKSMPTDDINVSADGSFVYKHESANQYIVTNNYTTLFVDDCDLGISSIEITLFEENASNNLELADRASVVLSAIEYIESEDSIRKATDLNSPIWESFCIVYDTILPEMKKTETLASTMYEGKSVLVYEGRYNWFLSYMEGGTFTEGDYTFTLPSQFILEGRVKD